MKNTHALKSLAELKSGDHLCCIYETEEEHRDLLTPFMRHGLEQGEKVLYIVDARTEDTILGYLRDDGMEVETYLESGQLGILGVNDAYMKEGVFDPEGMIALLHSATEQALAEGFSALRVIGEMTWVLRGLPGSERLIEYEAKLNDFFPGNKCLAICQYDRRKFDPSLLLNVLTTHPIAVIGTEIYENFYYLPPEDFLGTDPSAAKLNQWLNNLDEHKKAKKTLRESEKRIRLVLEGTDESLWDWDVVSGEITFDDNWPRVLGYTPGEIEFDFDWWNNSVHPDSTPVFEKALAAYLEGREKYYELEYQIRSKTGEWKWIWARGICVAYDKQGQPLRMIGTHRDITEHKKAEKALEHQTQHLEKVNTALQVLLDHREDEKKKTEDNVLTSLRKLVLPYVEKLEKGSLDGDSQTYVSIIKSNLANFLSPFLNTLSSRYKDFTPTEVEIAELIRQGKTSKDIASLLNVSCDTVSFHRSNIRKKLGLSHKKMNLRSYLLSLTS